MKANTPRLESSNANSALASAAEDNNAKGLCEDAQIPSSAAKAYAVPSGGKPPTNFASSTAN